MDTLFWFLSFDMLTIFSDQITFLPPDSSGMLVPINQIIQYQDCNVQNNTYYPKL